MDEDNIADLLITENQKELYKMAINKKKKFHFDEAISILEPLIHSIIQDCLSVYLGIFCKEKNKIEQFMAKINENAQLTSEQHQLFMLSKLFNVLVELYGQLTQYKKALCLCEMNKKLLHKLFSEVQTTEVLKMLGQCYAKTAKSNFFLSQYEKCEEDFVICHSIIKNNKLEESQENANLLLIEGNYFRFMFRDAEAEKCYLTGSGLMKSIFGPKSIQFADSCYGLANLYMDMGNFQESIQIINNALDIWRIQYPNELYPKISKSYYLLGNIYMRKGKSLAESKQNFERALEINLKLNQEMFQDTADIYHLIGRIYAEEKNKELFEKYFEKALDISQKLNDMDYEAKECFEKAIEVYLETCGAHHINRQFFTLFYNLISCIYIAVAITYKKCGECNQKLKLARSAISDYQNAVRIYLEKYEINWPGIKDLNKSIQELQQQIED